MAALTPNESLVHGIVDEMYIKLKDRIIQEIGSANEDQIKDIVLELRMDMADVIDRNVKYCLSGIFSKIAEELKSSIKE